MADTAKLHELVFEPVALDRVADSVVEQIEQLILTGVLRPGQKLPPERELSEVLGISRPKLREAFQVLAGRGLVEIRRSEGAFVEPLAGPTLSPRLIELFARHRSALVEFLEFRREQEAFAAALAAERATEADHEIIGVLVAEMAAAERQGDAAQKIALDLRFHLAIAESAHNAFLVHLMRSVYDLMRRPEFYDLPTLYNRAGASARILEQHRAIAEAVISGSPEAAAEASDQHHEYIAMANQASEAETRRRGIALKRRRLWDQLPLGPFSPRRRRGKGALLD
ncbi:MAG: FadR/GntR family transcriptional regulator [Pikeienuella sp.]